MNVWLENSKRNLLALSSEKSDFKTALKEWSFTGEIIDHETPIETCQLCEKDELRYHFQISNQLNNILWVGSKCIDKFDIKIIDEFGYEVTEHKEAYLLKQARKKHIKIAFEKLIQTKPIGKIQGRNKIDLDNYCITKYNQEEKLDPKMINYLFLRFEEESIFYEKRFFAINLKSQENKEKLLKLNRAQFERIKKALSIQQRKYYEENNGR